MPLRAVRVAFHGCRRSRCEATNALVKKCPEAALGTTAASDTCMPSRVCWARSEPWSSMGAAWRACRTCKTAQGGCAGPDAAFVTATPAGDAAVLWRGMSVRRQSPEASPPGGQISQRCPGGRVLEVVGPAVSGSVGCWPWPRAALLRLDARVPVQRPMGGATG